MKSPKPGSASRISLVLGSGGARGYAHIGVIEELEARGYRIESIAGSSMGAVIGGVYAAGKLDVYRRWVCALERIDILRLLDVSLLRNGLIKGERIMDVLKDLIGDCNIEDLPIAFTAVATDVERGKEVWIDQGSLFDAIRASIAIPTIFAAADLHGRTLVDGGLLNPIPVAPTLSDDTELTVAVNLSGKAELHLDTPRSASKPSDERMTDHRIINQFLDNLQQKFGQNDEKDLGLAEIVTRSWDIMQNTIARFQSALYRPDVTIDIPANACAFWEFHRAEELIELGRERTRVVVSPRP